MYGLFFDSEQELKDYMSDPEYGKNEDMPYMCAGISYQQGPGGPDDHEFKLHYNDWENYYFSMIPN